MKKSLVILIYLIPFLIGCGNKSYQCIDNIKKDYNFRNENNNIITTHKNFDPSKKIFNRLNNVLSDDFIYIFSWVNHLPLSGTNHFKCLIYDRKSKKHIYIFNTVENYKSLIITYSATDFNEEKLILDYYLEHRVDVLVSLRPAFISSEVGSEYYLLDSTSNKAYVIDNLVLDSNGEIFKK